MSNAATTFTILAAAVVVLGGLTALVRALWKGATFVRDNTLATRRLTEQMDALTKAVDGRFEHLAERISELEKRLRSHA